MNMEIKFRAWHKKANEMLYPEKQSYLFQWLEEGQPIEIMQCTGLKDINGKEIYEGDIVKFVFFTYDETEIEENKTGSIIYDNLGFLFHDNNGSYYMAGLMFDSESDIEIIGNIYEHPHILK